MSAMSGGSAREGKSILLGIGSNIDSPPEQLSRAVSSLRTQIEVDRVSSIYRSEPVGHSDQPDFYDLVCSARTELTPEQTLQMIRELEGSLGRTETFPNGPRRIDIDLLSYDDLVIHTSDLVIPHPRLHLRAFVLVPLNEIASEWRHPIFGKTAKEILSASGRLERIERCDRLP